MQNPDLNFSGLMVSPVPRPRDPRLVGHRLRIIRRPIHLRTCRLSRRRIASDYVVGSFSTLLDGFSTQSITVAYDCV